MKKEANNFHTKTFHELFKEFNSNANGLRNEEVESKRTEYGFNILPEKKQTSLFILLLKQFNSLLIYVLALAAIISFLFEKMVDFYVIMATIFINAIIGFFQDSKAEKAINALKAMIVPRAKVLRDGELIQIPAKNLIPGDIILIEEGDRIPADARLIEIKNFRTVESALTGESFPVDKTLRVLPEKTALADQKNMIWLGTFVASGQAKAIVVATGSETTIGKLALSIETIHPKKSHFKEKTDALAKTLAIFSFFGAILISLIGIFYEKFSTKEEVFRFALASLVAGIPEGLPAVLAIVLAIGSYRMAKRKAIVRDRYATETLGVVDTIITDKTGTLTTNTMTAQKIILLGQTEISVTGSGWTPQGEFYQNSKQIVPLENKHLDKFLHIVSICNNATLVKKEDHVKRYEIIGDPTEAALLVLAEKAGLKKLALLQEEKKIDDFPFNTKLKYHASLSVLTERENKKQIYIVGSPEAVINSSTFILKNGRKTKLTKAYRSLLEKNIISLTHKAMRVLAVAYKEVSKETKELSEQDFTQLILVGLVGIHDPPRPEVREAIAKAKKAGIRVVMATGDHRNTALAIAREIGLIEEHHDKNHPLALTGVELSEMSEAQFENAVKHVSVFARLTPETKLKIAKVLQKQGHVVAMTGDGVNDAPALRQADIGISMSIIGTDVAREASSMVLADDNFATIINAIEEGRIVFINTRQTSFFYVTTSFAEYATLLATLFLRLPLPLLPTQILWLNLVTAGVTDVALATEQSHQDVLEEKPRNKNENIINKEVIPFLVLITATMMLITISVFIYHLPDLNKARTAAFVAISAAHFFNVVSLRSLKLPIFKIGYFSNKYVNASLIASIFLLLIAIYNPFLQNVFEFSRISYTEVLVIFALCSSTLLAGEIYKTIKKQKKFLM